MKRLALLLLAACAPSETGVRVELSFNEVIEQLSIVVEENAQPSPPRLISDKMLTSGMHLNLLVPDDWDGREVRVEILGLVAGREVTRGEGRAKIRAGTLVDVAICLGVACNVERCKTPPANSCFEDKTLRAYVPVGVAGSDGSCTYPYWDVFCQDGCSAGKCVGDDPCNNISCITPPAAMCSDAHSLVTYANAGSCSAGECSYAKTTTRCAAGCDNGTCPGDPCAGIACNLPPKAICKDESILLSYAAGVCTDGDCSYATVEQGCEFGCENDHCVGNPCAGMVCTQPWSPVCVNSSRRRSFGANGVCDSATVECVYPEKDEDCPPPAANGVGACVGAGECTFACASGYSPQGGTCVVAPTALALGGFHSCAIVGGELKCWGKNTFGQLGNNSSSNRYSPTVVQGFSAKVTAVSGGFNHTCALANGGYCWGDNGAGQLGDNTTVNRLVPTMVQGSTAAWTTIGAGASHSCALVGGTTFGGGPPYCWGNNASGQLGDGTGVAKAVPTAVESPRFVIGWNLYQLAVGSSHNCGSLQGTGYCWGENSEFQLGNSTGTDELIPIAGGSGSGITKLAAGRSHTCAIINGDGWCWGQNLYGQLGDSTFTSRSIAARVSGLPHNVTAIAVGAAHSCAVVNGGVQCWGQNLFGALGDNSTTSRNAPAAVTGLSSGVTLIAAGDAHTCALQGTQLWCWGKNSEGQLGDGTTFTRLVPTAVQGL